jgi:hypothetical protein
MRIAERLGDHTAVRGLLALLRPLPLDRTWRLLVEGALFEERINNVPAVSSIGGWFFLCRLSLKPVNAGACRVCRVDLGRAVAWSRVSRGRTRGGADGGFCVCIAFGFDWVSRFSQIWPSLVQGLRFKKIMYNFNSYMPDFFDI